MAAVSLYFLIQVPGCQLGSAQIKDPHPQSVLSSHQWHALVLLLFCDRSPRHTSVSSQCWRFSIMRSWCFFFKPTSPKLFIFGVYLSQHRGWGCFPHSEPAQFILSHSLAGQRLKQKDWAVPNSFKSSQKNNLLTETYNSVVVSVSEPTYEWYFFNEAS